MARPREFSEPVVLQAAIDCFWQRGYEATSVRNLSIKMGMSTPSLYNAYGDKRGLYMRALEYYLDRTARALIERLERSSPPKQAVRRFIEEIIEDSVSDAKRRGCFLVNSALEVAPHDRKLRAFITSRLTEIEEFFCRSIEAAQAQGQIPKERSAKDLARLFLSVLLGVRVLARSRPERSLLEDIARPVFALLD